MDTTFLMSKPCSVHKKCRYFPTECVLLHKFLRGHKFLSVLGKYTDSSAWSYDHADLKMVGNYIMFKKV